MSPHDNYVSVINYKIIYYRRLLRTAATTIIPANRIIGIIRMFQPWPRMPIEVLTLVVSVDTTIEEVVVKSVVTVVTKSVYVDVV